MIFYFETIKNLIEFTNQSFCVEPQRRIKLVTYPRRNVTAFNRSPRDLLNQRHYFYICRQFIFISLDITSILNSSSTNLVLISLIRYLPMTETFIYINTFTLPSPISISRYFVVIDCSSPTYLIKKYFIVSLPRFIFSMRKGDMKHRSCCIQKKENNFRIRIEFFKFEERLNESLV